MPPCAHHGPPIVAAGSNRDKSVRRFFYAPLVSFPPLGEDYITWSLEQLGFRAELQAPGGGFAAASKALQRLRALLRASNGNCAMSGAEVAIDLRRRLRVKLPDALIAATALAHGLSMLTLDADLSALLASASG